TYAYDGEGRRVKRTLGGQTTVYVYSATGELAAEYGGDTGGSGTSYLTADALGSTRLVTKASGSSTEIAASRRDYLPFGEEIPAGVGGRSALWSASLGMAQKFTGKERGDALSENGLDYFGARYFSGAQGRFTSPDPFNILIEAQDQDDFNAYISNPQNWNKYVYTWNNPLRYIDPDGENVYVVAYTTGNSHGDDEFRRAAETLANEIRNRKGFDPKKDTVLVRGVMSKADFKGLIADANKLDKAFGKVEQVNLIAHNQNDRAGVGPVFHYAPGYGHTELFSRSELGQVSVNWSSSATACFVGCRTAPGFTRMFGDAQGVTSLGYERYAYFSSSRSKMVPIGPTGPVYLQGGDGPSSNGPISAIRYWLGLGQPDAMKAYTPAPRKPR
ncbi:MAG: RHS repeat-associated core domain-containing protein, partial [Bryobacteraceae bacterium]